MKRLFEQFYPYIFATIAIAICRNMDVNALGVPNLLSSTLTMSGIFVGFLATSKAILMTGGSDVVSDLKSSGYKSDLVSYIGCAIWSALFFCLICIFGLFMDAPNRIFDLIWVWTGVLAFTAFFRVTYVMMAIFRVS